MHFRSLLASGRQNFKCCPEGTFSGKGGHDARGKARIFNFAAFCYDLAVVGTDDAERVLRFGRKGVLKAYSDRWALITGASSGIGAEFARLLAGRGMHLVLVARRRELMEELAEELDTRHGTQTEIIVSDLGEPGQVKQLVDETNSRGVTVDLLVNNAGFGFVGEFATTDVDRMSEMIRVNIAALTELTYAFLPGMLQRGEGAVINVASVAGFQPVAYMPVYSATKAFVLHFSEALWAELRDHGVTVTALCPGTTRTEFFDVAGVSGWLAKHSAHTPEQVVKAGLKALERRRQYVIPGWKNYLIAMATRLARRKEVVLQSMKFFRPRKKKPKKTSDEGSRDEATTSP